MSRFPLLLLLVVGWITFSTTPADAHLATFGSWEITVKYLKELFPDATRFMVRNDSYSDQQVEAIERDLGFKLYPEDRDPVFYVALDESGERPRFLGVAIFVDPRLQPRILDGAVIRLEVGIGVNPRGEVHRVRVFEYRGNLSLTRPAFLDQFNGMKIEDNFQIGKRVQAVRGEEEESQLVANAAYAALYLMRMSLGTGR